MRPSGSPTARFSPVVLPVAFPLLEVFGDLGLACVIAPSADTEGETIIHQLYSPLLVTANRPLPKPRVMNRDSVAKIEGDTYINARRGSSTNSGQKTGTKGPDQLANTLDTHYGL